MIYLPGGGAVEYRALRVGCRNHLVLNPEGRNTRTISNPSFSLITMEAHRPEFSLRKLRERIREACEQYKTPANVAILGFKDTLNDCVSYRYISGHSVASIIIYCAVVFPRDTSLSVDLDAMSDEDISKLHRFALEGFVNLDQTNYLA